MRVGRIAGIKEAGGAGRDATFVGNRTRVKIAKNKLAPPFREVEFDIIYGKGISREGDVLDLAVEAGIVEKSGSWFSFAGERLGQGREKVRTFLEENPDVCDKLAGLILAKHGLGGDASDAAASSAAASSTARETDQDPKAAAPDAPRGGPNGGAKSSRRAQARN
jgi:recombination protein RecA